MAPVQGSALLSSMRPLKDVQLAVNERYDSAFRREKSGKLLPWVCCVCDEYILHENSKVVITIRKMKAVAKLLSWERVPKEHQIPAIVSYYKFGDLDSPSLKKEKEWVKTLVLSPRGCLYKKGKGCQIGFLTCPTCKQCIDNGELPYFAIRNGNYTGPTPECLRVLNEVELSFLQAEKTHGVCHVWNGGKQLRGNMTFMRVEERRVASAVAALEGKGISKNIVVLCHGRMTDWQRKRYAERTKVRTDKLIEAVKWLCEFHQSWKHLNFDDLVQELQSTRCIRVDRSYHCDANNVGVEEEEIFTCYYPDGASTERSGGFDEPGAFKKFVDEMSQANFDVEMTANLQKKFVKENDNDQLLGSCLLQFPYGICGLDEKRERKDGSFTVATDIDLFVQHLSRLSNPYFQHGMIQLIMYNMISRKRLLTASRLQARGKLKASEIANALNYKDLHDAIRSRNNGHRFGGTSVSRKFLDSVDACTKSLPHTNLAAKAARATGECMQHHFGTGSIFLTVTFDDEHCILTQVLAGDIIDKDCDVDKLTDQELAEKAKARKQLRLKFPGVCALNFEILLQILCEEVIGWDLKNDRPTDGPGHYGYCDALSMAMEEQGRKSVHTHMTLWIRHYRELQHQLFFAKKAEKIKAEGILKKYYDAVATTELLSGHGESSYMTAWDHECTCCNAHEKILPLVVDDQELRYLRHRVGHKINDGKFASCIHCDKKWTNAELVNSFLERKDGLTSPDGKSKPEETEKNLQKHRMHAKIIEFQKEQGSPITGKVRRLINATYQTHSCEHHNSCFKCAKKKGAEKRKHTCGPLCECRYRLPDRKRPKTIVNTQKENAAWYSWTGEEKKQPLIQFLPKRGTYDLFQNISSQAVSESKFACNSNIALITDGPIGQYQFKYHLKGTQEDDTAEYAHVDASIKKVTGKLHENDRCEAVRLITRAAFAHNKTNVINAPLASFLIRNSSRFYFSHEFKYCPLRDVMRLHKNQGVDSFLKYSSEGGNFFENIALHYLCRPDIAEHCSLRQFTEEFEVKYMTRASKRDGAVGFIPDTGFFQHPSRHEIEEKGNTVVECRQGIMEREVPVLIKVSQWMFPDTATFRADILACDETEFNNQMELYAEICLTLFLPHRHVGDLKMSGGCTFPFTRKFREIYETETLDIAYNKEPVVFTERNRKFLQNIQDARSNSLRYKVKSDDLASDTRPFTPAECQMNLHLDSDEEEEPDDEDGTYEDFMQHMDFEVVPSPHDSDPEYLNETLKDFEFESIRNEGTRSSGYLCDNGVTAVKIETVTEEDFVSVPATLSADTSATEPKQRFLKKRKVYTAHALVQIILRRSEKKLHKNLFRDEDVEIREANGTVSSIREWGAMAFATDKKQRRAFEIIVAAFLLTFFTEAKEDGEDTEPGDLTKFRRAKIALLRLRGDRKKAQLICLLYGPGGSGKSTVINTVLAYAKSFCKSIGHRFTPRTIIITAMSGVAATLLHGETTHSVIGLNRSRVSEDEIDDFSDARLLIIDEISFAAKPDFQKLYSKCRELMRNHYEAYGGLNLVLSGDYSQVEPVKQLPIYKEDMVPEFHSCINCFIELDGQWRFRDDPKWGDMMYRFREGCPTTEDIHIINTECHIQVKKPPAGLQIATHTNKNRDAVNACMFEEFCRVNRPEDGSVLKHAAMIFMDDLSMKNSHGVQVPLTSNAVKKFFYEHCSESKCDVGEKGRVDPVLRVYVGCPMMFTQNKDVANGQANGSRITLKSIRMKFGEKPFELRLACGTIVYGMYASQVQSLLVQHEAPDIEPATFFVETQDWTFTCKLTIADEEMTTSMKGKQFPLISNICTTGHKLQGCTCTDLLVNEWHYGSNWAYVVLSRVRTMKGLYIRQLLSYDLKKYEKPKEMKEMLEYFRNKCLFKILTDEEYDEIIFASEV